MIDSHMLLKKNNSSEGSEKENEILEKENQDDKDYETVDWDMDDYLGDTPFPRWG